MVVTRFNPSPNGGLHVGHVYMAILNREIARAAGGTYRVRVADYPHYYQRYGEWRVRAVGHEIEDDLHWLGLEPDVPYTWETDYEEEVQELLAGHGLLEGVPICSDAYREAIVPYCVAHPDVLVHGYQPELTLYKVAVDHIEGISLLVRGEEMLGEFALYYYYCDRLAIRAPRMVFTPRLRTAAGNISKTLGGYKVAELRANGYTPEDIMVGLRDCCLRWPSMPWSLENLVPQPVLTL